MKVFLAAAGLCVGTSAWATDPYTLTDNGDGTWTETYDFDAAKRGKGQGNTYFTRVEAFNNVGEGERTYYSFDCDRIELNERFSADELPEGTPEKRWEIGASTPLHHSFGTVHGFQVLKLKAGDKVAFYYTGTVSFRGTPNVTDAVSDGTALVNGTEYTIKEDNPLTVTVANNTTTQISKITITTSAPVLARPSFSFSEMTKSGDYYNPTFVPTSTDDGVTFKKKDDDTDVTSGYTFTSAGPLTVYASMDGRPNSARASYTVTAAQVGMILANSVLPSSIVGNVNYNTGVTIADGTDVTGSWALPGLTFGGNSWYFRSNIVRQEKDPQSVSCTVLNENRVAVLKHRHHKTETEAEYLAYDYLTSTSNSASFSKQTISGVKYYSQFEQYDLYVNPSEVVSVTIGATGYTTFSSPVPLDFSGVSGLTAYVARSVGDGAVHLTSVTTAPANTGLVLAGTPNATYNIPVTASAEAPASNMLVGCIVSTTVAADATSGFNNYVLVNEGGTAKFQSLVENGATIPADKAFLNAGTYSAARSLQIVFDDVTTSISRIDNGEFLRPSEQASPWAERKVENLVYDLQGRRVNQPMKGLYIVNGKKVIMK